MKTKTIVQTPLREPVASRARQLAIREKYEQAAQTSAKNGTTAPRWVRWFDSFGIEDVSLVGGKNASLGEMMRELSGLGIHIPDGFAVTAEGYRHFIAANHLHKPITRLLADLKPNDVESLELDWPQNSQFDFEGQVARRP